MSHTPQRINKAFNQKAKIMSPCYECPDRTVEPNCHANCERYEKFKADYKAANKNENKQRKKWW